MRCFPRSAVGCSLGLIGFSLMIVTTMAHSAQPVDLLKLRDALCEYETRGCSARNRMCPDADDARGLGGELGFCQLKPETLRQIGFKGKWRTLYVEALDRDRSKYWAHQKLLHCAQPFYRLIGQRWSMTRQGYTTAEGFIWCYHYGLDAGKVDKTDPYVVAVIALYNKALIAQR